MKGEIMTHNKGYNDKMKYKTYDRTKHKTHERRNHNHITSEIKLNNMIERYKEEIEEMKLEMEMY